MTRFRLSPQRRRDGQLLRAATTLTELLVLFSVIGILASLLLPAVQASREAARRTMCTAHLRQIGVALHSYHAAHNRFPLTANFVFHAGSDHNAYSQSIGFSAHAYLLVHIDETLYNSINFDDNHLDSASRESEQNRSAFVTKLDAFLCPSDAQPQSWHGGGNNYRCNLGARPTRYFPPRLGFFDLFRCRSAQEIVDGLANTIAFGEKPRGDGRSEAFTPHSEYFFSPFRGLLEPEEVAMACERAPSLLPPHESAVGESWLFASYRLTWYNHVLPPNSRVPDCTTDEFGHTGAFAARSYHPGGVNSLMADGAVRSIANSVDLPAWRALATVAGVEGAAY